MDCSNIRLVGGVVFALFMHAKSLARNNHTTEYYCYKRIVEIITKETMNVGISSLKVDAITYKKCEYEDYISYRLKELRRNFDDDFKKNKGYYLREFKDLVKEVLTTPESQIWFAGSLLQLILEDKTIDENQVLYAANYNCYKVTKKELSDTQYTDIYLVSLLVGIYHYLLSKDINNIEGRQGFLYLFQQDNTNRFRLVKDITNNLNRDINISLDAKVSDDDPVNVEIELSSDPDSFTKEEAGEDAEYLNRAYDEYNKIKTLLYSEIEHKFYDFYVCNNLSIANSSRYNASLMASRMPINSKGVVYDAEALKIKNRMVISAPGGYGKSMMMRHALLSTIKQYRKQRVLPIMVNIRDYDFQGSIESLFYEAYTNLGGECTEKSFEKKLKKGKLLLILDGLDEVQQRAFSKFERLLNKFAAKNAQNYIIVTSRPYSEFINLNGFKHYTLEPFTKNQALELIERIDFKKDTPDVKNKFKILLDQYLYEGYKSFANNPLLLTLMLITYGDKLEIPESMPEFYDAVYNVLTYKHDHEKGFHRDLELKINLDEFKKIFTEFCFETYYDGRYTFTKDQVVNYFSKLESAMELDVDNQGSSFANDITQSVCIMLEDAGHYDFIHRSFQEYFVARYLSLSSDDDFKEIGKDVSTNPGFIESEFVFEMLYYMQPEKVEKYVFLPYLREIFNNVNFEDFLVKYAKDISYRTDTCSMALFMSTKDWILNLISRLKLKNRGYSHISIPDSFKQHRDLIIKIPLLTKNDTLEKVDEDNVLFANMFLNDCEIDIKSDTYTIDFPTLIKEKEKYSDIYEVYVSKKSPYYMLYTDLKRYYDSLVNIANTKRFSIAERLKKNRGLKKI